MSGLRNDGESDIKLSLGAKYVLVREPYSPGVVFFYISGFRSYNFK